METKKEKINAAFDAARKKAEKIVGDKNKLKKILQNAFEKAKSCKGPLEKIWDDIQLLFRLLKAWHRGEYTAVPWRTLVSGIAFLIYFINPFDIIPDFIPLIGYFDDIALGIVVFKSIRKDLFDFNEWEESQQINI